MIIDGSNRFLIINLMANENTRKQAEELTLLLLFLTSWTEKEKVSGTELHRAWKGYDFDVLDQLDEEGLISNSKKAKSVYLTEAGMAKAERLAEKYLRDFT